LISTIFAVTINIADSVVLLLRKSEGAGSVFNEKTSWCARAQQN
tara:strand:- start:421 stop:552 length:132 start_codon:yes stop_codon:yes gene_type:complete